MVAVAAEELSELSCVLIPLMETGLLLPNISIAEILPWRRVKVIKESPNWCLGMLGWRGESIPVVRFEVINGGEAPQRKAGRCMIVMNRARLANGLPFYAIAAEGLPRMLQLTQDDINNEPGRLGPAESVMVRVGTETAVIPNLEFIEGEISGLVRNRAANR